MVNKFTKGEWKVVEGPQGNVPIPKEHCAAATVYVWDDKRGINKVIASSTYSEEDAHLISAAPDMYEALGAVWNDPDMRMSDTSFELLEKALAKARGEQ